MAQRIKVTIKVNSAIELREAINRLSHAVNDMNFAFTDDELIDAVRIDIKDQFKIKIKNE